ncbi:MAG: DUF5658 family protein [Methanoregula sp.]|nr:DUF5658 family protein [Methanoregula sp.]
MSVWSSRIEPDITIRISRFISSDIKTSFFLGILIFYTLCLLDILTTDRAISHGGYEMNPIMAPIVGIPVLHLLEKWLTVIFVIMVALWCEERVVKSGYLILSAVIGLYLFVIAHNITILFRLIIGS